jgi:DNA-binding transcriptional regulator YiaG
MYHFTDGGLRNVWLKNGYVEKDTPYGKAVSFHDLDGLTKAICMALVNKPGKLSGAEFRYIRSGLLLSQKSLGKLLGCTEQAVAKWEKTGKVPKTSDLVIRMLYKHAHDGKEGVVATVEMLNIIDRISHSRIIVSEAHHKWTSKVEDQEPALA